MDGFAASYLLRKHKPRQHRKTTIITLCSALLASLALSSCSTTAGNVAAGAVAGAAIKEAHDEKEREEFAEDAYWYKKNKQKQNRKRD